MGATPVAPGVVQLLVDDALLAATRGVWRCLHPAVKAEENPILHADRPWEGFLVLQPGTVTFDRREQRFKMWYNTQPTRERPDIPGYVCYAVSDDGVHWQKPELGLVEHDGSTANNILLAHAKWTVCVLHDPEDPAPERRYKMVYWGQPPDGAGGIYAAFSPDGVDWRLDERNPVVPGVWATGDTFSAMRDPASGRYWLYHKTPLEPIRTVSRMISDDFVHWRDSRRVLAPDAFDPPDTQFYGLSAFPQAGQYLGFLWVYHTDAQTVDVQLVSSRDGLRWERTAGRRPFMHLLPTSRSTGEEFDRRMIYPSSAPVERDGRLRIYYSGFSVPHNAFAEDHDGRIGLAHLPPNGFCSLQATGPGWVLTTPFRLDGTRLTVRARIHGPGPRTGRTEPVWAEVFAGCRSGCGSVAVEVQDAGGAPIPGYSAAECEALTHDPAADAADGGPELPVRWRARDDLTALSGSTVRLRFVLRHARLYSWCVRS